MLAWLLAPLRAGLLYPGMPCTAQADTIFRLLSSTLIFIPVGVFLLVLARWIRRARALDHCTAGGAAARSR